MNLHNLISKNGTVVMGTKEVPAQIESGAGRGEDVVERLSVATFDGKIYTGQVHAYNAGDLNALGITPAMSVMLPPKVGS